jgi:hypothetical protein
MQFKLSQTSKTKAQSPKTNVLSVLDNHALDNIGNVLTAVDRCENVSNIIESVIIKHT